MSRLFLVGVILLTTALVATFAPADFAWDYVDSFRPAALALMHGGSPYQADYGFYGPPWALFPLVPLAVLPVKLGAGLLTGLNVVIFLVLARKMGAGWAGTLLLLASPPAVLSLWNGNLEPLTLLGLLMPPWLGLFFVSIKPQVGAGLAVFWMVEAYRAGGLRRIARNFAPVTAAMVISFVIYGLWPLHAKGLIAGQHNASFWPWSLAVGLAMIVYAIRTMRRDWAIVAGPALAPYGTVASWCGPLLALSHNRAEMIAAVVALWLAMISTGAIAR